MLAVLSMSAQLVKAICTRQFTKSAATTALLQRWLLTLLSALYVQVRSFKEQLAKWDVPLVSNQVSTIAHHAYHTLLLDQCHAC
jgi:hypothetical protein